MQNPIKTIRNHLRTEAKEEISSLPVNLNEANICVVFNMVDHVSILAATIFACFMRSGSSNVTMVDIRDVIPETCDLYYWIDCGDFEAFMKYYTNGGTRIVSLSKESRDWIYRLKSISSFINGSRTMLPDSPEYQCMTADILIDIIHGWLSTRLPSTDSTLLDPLEATEPLTQNEEIRALGLSKDIVLKWPSVEMSSLATAKTESLLTMLHSHYTRGIGLDTPMLLKQLQEIADASRFTNSSDKGEEDSISWSSSPSDRCVLRYREAQKKASAIIAVKTRNVCLGGKFFKYATDLSSLIYSMFRRMSVSGNKYIHVSHGAYGTIVYSNTSLEGVVDFVERGSFVLTK